MARPPGRATTLYMGSLSDRVVQWLRENPEEELTATDISVKFAYRRGSVHLRMQPALRLGLVEWVGDKRPHRYRLPHRSQSLHSCSN